jgi:hypothetical protein
MLADVRTARAEATVAPDATTRRGLLFRIDAGVSFNQFAANDVTVRSILFGPTISLGGSLSPGLVLGGGLALQLGRVYETKNYVLEQNAVPVVWPRAFAMIDYYPVVDGLVHVGGAVGYGHLGALGRECDCYNVSGALNYAGGSFVAAPHVGLDWTISRDWSVGPLVRLWLSPTNRYGHTGFIVAPEVAFAATFY